MAEIAIEGPNAIDAVKKLQKVLGAEQVLAWDLSPTVPNVVRVDLTMTMTPAEACQFMDRAAYENRWIDHAGWFARFKYPDEEGGQVAGVVI